MAYKALHGLVPATLPSLFPPSILCSSFTTVIFKTLEKNLALSLLRLQNYTSPGPEGLSQLYLLREASSLAGDES